MQKLFKAPVRSLFVAWNVFSAAVGLVSLTFVVLEFSRMHYTVFWACNEQPQRLFLGLLDTSRGTWARSLVVGLHAFCSMLSRACLYTLMYAIPLGLIDDQVLAVLVPSIAVVAVSLSSNLLLLIPMRSRKMLPAAIISMWVTVPWIAAPIDQIKAGKSRYVLLRACWPAWVAEFLYSLSTIAVAVAFQMALKRWVNYYNYASKAFSDRIDIVGGDLVFDWTVVTIMATALPSACALCSLLCFVGLTGWILQKRHAFLRQDPGGRLLELSPLRPVRNLPSSLLYRWSWGDWSLHLVKRSAPAWARRIKNAEGGEREVSILELPLEATRWQVES